MFPLLGLSFFPRTDAGQFMINLKAPTGTRLAVTENEVAKVENLICHTVAPEDLGSSSPTSVRSQASPPSTPPTPPCTRRSSR
jgi:multidrug efflux pump subunit AcrB